MKTRLDVTVLDLIREKQGLTSDKQLAEKLGVSASTVRNWRSGSYLPSTSTLVKMQFLSGRPYGTMLMLPKTAAA